MRGDSGQVDGAGGYRSSNDGTVRMRSWFRRDRVAVVASVIAPLAVAAALVPVRASVANTDAALVLVLVVVAVAANGHRAAGILTAIGAAVWFDFFLTKPFEHFTINGRADIETTVLLLLVGIAVTELAVWGRQQHVQAGQQAGYLAGIRDAAGSVADDASPTVVIDQVCDQVTRLLGLRRCRFDYGTGVLGGDHPRLRSDGQVEVHGDICDVDRLGLPTDHDIELLLTSAGRFRGRFLLTAAADSRPSLVQRLVAIGLADRAGAAQAEHDLTQA
jgi:Domain of unknown function (DUF4118)